MAAEELDAFQSLTPEELERALELADVIRRLLWPLERDARRRVLVGAAFLLGAPFTALWLADA